MADYAPNPPSQALLVTGATGKQGGAVIDALLALNASGKTNFTLLAVTRDTTSASAQRLLQKSAQIKLIQGNLDDVPALFAAAHKELLSTSTSPTIHGVYSVQVSLGPGVTVEGEIAQGKALIDGAIAHGVRHFVYSSVERGGDERSWDNPTPIPHFQSKHQIEHYLRDVTAIKSTGSVGADEHMEWTILRPVAFMDNLAPGVPTKVFMTALRNHLGEGGAGKKLQWVATKDIGVFAGMAFADMDGWKGRAVGLAGDELNMDELNVAFARATGQGAPGTFGFLGSVLTYMVREMGLMIGWFASEGYKADVGKRRREHEGLLTMEKWLAQESAFVARG